MVSRVGKARNGWAQLAEVITGGAPRPSATAATAPLPVLTQVASPMADTSTLSTIVWQDLTGGADLPMTRAAAMRIPAVVRLRNLLCGTIGRIPLRAMRGADPLADEAQPTWTYRTDAGGLPPYHRMVWTVDDLIFTGWSLWGRSNSVVTTTDEGRPLAMSRIPQERWRFTPLGTIEVAWDGRTWVEAQASQVCLIPGAHEGILNFGGAALREAKDLADSAANAARNPSAWLNLHYTGDEPMSDDDIDGIIARWAAARRGENGGVSWTNKWIEAQEMGTHEAHLLTEGRNAAAVDMARLVNVPAAMIDATSAGASLTYETTDGRNRQFLDYGLSLYMDPIAARLSMDDVVARGTRVAFDTTDLTTPAPAPTGAPTQD